MGKKNQTGEATIPFVESEPWEHDELLQRCEHGCQVISRDHRLEELPDSGLPENVTILSTFIHSRVTADQLSRLPDLKFIATRSTGFDHINIEECNRRGILVSNVPHYGENTVAEHTFALLLALTRKIHRGYERTIRATSA